MLFVSAIAPATGQEGWGGTVRHWLYEVCVPVKSKNNRISRVLLFFKRCKKKCAENGVGPLSVEGRAFFIDRAYGFGRKVDIINRCSQ